MPGYATAHSFAALWAKGAIRWIVSMSTSIQVRRGRKFRNHSTIWADSTFPGAITGRYHHSMKLTSLRALTAAVEEGSLRAAARRLGVSQPALTKLIRELETELATSLLLRSTTGVLATAQGMVLYEHAIAA
jgi:hypothetical protein